MPNDAKLGLVVGVGLVIIIAVVFFRKDTQAATPPADPATPAAVGIPPVTKAAQVQPAGVQATPVGQSPERADSPRPTLLPPADVIPPSRE